MILPFNKMLNTLEGAGFTKMECKLGEWSVQSWI
jgi:hypothetical protein